MRLEIVRSPAAKSDLIELWEYIAADSLRAADGMLDRIAKSLDMICDHAEAGRERPELAEGLRSIVCGRYVLYYRRIEHSIVLVRVRSGYLDVDQIDFS